MTDPRADNTCIGCQAEFPPDALFCPTCGLPAPKSRATQLAATDTFIGKLIGDRYLLQTRIGDGASGIIYRAEHITLRRPVAVKLLHHKLSKDDLAIERFRREATTVAEIDNDHVVKVFDFGRAPDGRLFFVMEFLEGETLAQAIASQAKMPVPRIVDVLVQICEALMEAHAMGYVHRDLRPGNIFLTNKRGRKDYVKLLDFGLAKLLTPGGEASQTTLGMTFGDPRYMSPEQARGQTLDRRSDIYALGIIGYEMLCGKPPFGGQKTLDVLQKQLEVIPTPPSAVRKDVPTWLEAIELRALAKRPDDRFVTVMRMIEAIKKGEAEGPRPVEPSAPGQLPPLEEQGVDPRRDALAVFGRDTIPDTHPPFEANVVDTAQPTTAAHEPPAPNPFANMPNTDRDPVVPPIAVEPRPDSIPEPVAISSVPTVNVLSPPQEPTSASQQFFATAASQPSAPAAPQPYAPAPSAYAEPATARSAWDEEPVPKGVPKGLKLAIGGMGVVILGIGVFMFWPRKAPENLLIVAPPAPAPAPTPPPPLPTPPPPTSAIPAPPPAIANVDKPAPPPRVETPKAEKAPPAERAQKPTPPPKAVAKATPSPPKPENPAPERPEKAEKPERLDKPKPAKVAATNDQPLDPYAQPLPPSSSPPSAGAPTSEEAQAEGYIKMGRLFLQRQDFAKAAAAFNRAREHDPRNADAIAGLGQISYHQAKYDDAAVHFRAAVRLAPSRASFHVWLGHSLLGAGHAREAETEYRAALQIEPSNGPAQQGLDAAQKR